MKAPGKIALVRMPGTNLEPGKNRPVLMIAPVPGQYGDWLVCMFSTQIHQAQAGFDEIIQMSDEDYETSGLKTVSVIRIGRLAVVASELLVGSIGNIGSNRLSRIKKNLARWISEE
jgi:mRNA interferase MazF